jgi:hypothetical protein
LAYRRSNNNKKRGGVVDTQDHQAPIPAPASTIAPWPAPLPAARFQHSHSIAAGTLANAGIKGPLEDIDSSGALDLTFAGERAADKVANVKSAPLEQRGFTTADILWALGIWSVIICLSPMIVFYMLMVA